MEKNFVQKFSVLYCRTNERKTIQLFDLLPVEMLDIILRKSYILFVSKAESNHQTNADIIVALSSVNFFWFQWIRSGKFKRSLWRHVKVYCDEAKKTATIITNNGNYLMGNIQPNEEFLAMLLSVDCLKEKHVSLIEKLKYDKDKNFEILRIMRSADETKYRNFIRCLRQTKQWNVAKVVERGGVVLKAEFLNFGSKQNQTSEAQQSLQERIQQLVRTLNDIIQDNMENNSKIKSLIFQPKNENISILSSSVDTGNGIVVWIWCRSQDSLEKLHEMYESKRLEAIFRDLLSSCSSGLDFCREIKLRIDGSYFQRKISVTSIASCSFGAKLEMKENPIVRGVTKLWNQIHVLCESNDWSHRWLALFEDEVPFRLQKKMEINETKTPWDIVSSETENCLYVSDYDAIIGEGCIWKIKQDGSGGHQMTKWLTGIKPGINHNNVLTLSVSSDGRLLIPSREGMSLSLSIYGPDAQLHHSFSLQRDDFKDMIYHSVETSKGNFVICHQSREEEVNKEKRQEEEDEEEEDKKDQEKEIRKNSVMEVRKDGSFIRRFIPKDGNQILNWPQYLSIDSDDRLILADYHNDRVILLDSDLKWNRILIPTEEDKQMGRRIKLPWRLCCDDEKNQLIIGAAGGINDGGGAYVYSLNWK